MGYELIVGVFIIIIIFYIIFGFGGGEIDCGCGCGGAKKRIQKLMFWKAAEKESFVAKPSELTISQQRRTAKYTIPTIKHRPALI